MCTHTLLVQVGLVRQEPGQNQQAVRYQGDGGKPASMENSTPLSLSYSLFPTIYLYAIADTRDVEVGRVNHSMEFLTAGKWAWTVAPTPTTNTRRCQVGRRRNLLNMFRMVYPSSALFHGSASSRCSILRGTYDFPVAPWRSSHPSWSNFRSVSR